MYEQFGAVATDPTVEFRVFFPDTAHDPGQYVNGGTPKIAKLQVAGDFQSKIGGIDWDYLNGPELVRSLHPKGWLYSYRIDRLADGFYQYKYYVTFENGTTRWCGDPCTKYNAGPEENAGFVIGGNDTLVDPLPNRLPLPDLVIYELMIDDFTSQYRGNRAPVDAVKDKIGDLLDLGINAIEFMPWTAWRGGDFSWGYDPFLFFSVENRYIEDPSNSLDRLYRLKTLINDLHRRGIHVILDGVFNHVSAGLDPGNGFPYHWLYQDPSDSPFTGGFADAGYFEDLDFNNACTEEFIFDICKYWIEEYQIDGIRFDYTRGFYRRGDRLRGITKLVADLREFLGNTGRENVTLMLEHLPDNRYEAIGDTNEIGADGCWYDRLFFDVPDAAVAGNLDTKVVRVVDTARDFDLGKGPVIYIENHDHSTLTNRAGGRDLWWKTQPAMLALVTVPGAVLIHNGQEFGDDHYLPADGPGRVVPRAVNWGYRHDAVGTSLYELYRRLLRLRSDHPGLRSPHFYPRFYDEHWIRFNEQGYGVDVDRDLLIYHRWGDGDDGRLERFMIVINVSAYDQFVDVPFPDSGNWDDILNGGTAWVDGYWLRNERINSHWGKIFFKKS